MKLTQNYSFKRGAPVITLWLFAIYPIIVLYAHNADQLLLKQLFQPVIFVLISSTIIFGFLLIILRNILKATIATVVFFIIFWNYGLMYHEFTKVINLKHWHLLPLLIFLYCHLIYFINKIKQKNTLTNLNTILLLPITILVLFNIITIIPVEFKKYKTNSNRNLANSLVHHADAGKYYPDIYVIILDEFANLQTIKEEWGYDNSAFAGFLKEKGFFIAEKSESRYDQTTWSLSSLLNLDYITGPVDRNTFMDFVYNPSRIKGTDAYSMLMKYDFNAQIGRMSDNYLTKFMKDMGYTTVVLEGFSRFYSQYVPQNADLVFSYQNVDKTNKYRFLIDAFYIELIKQSMLSPFDIVLKNNQAGDVGYDGTRYVFNYLNNDAKGVKSPKFIYSHILCPHSPHVFSREGNFVFPITPEEQRVDGLIPEQNTVNKAYLEQYIYVTNEIKKLVDSQIQKNNTSNPVVLIFSDHGPRPHELYLKNKLNSFKVFNAAYFPDGNYNNLYDSIAPVNLLRVVLNRFLGENYKMLEDK